MARRVIRGSAGWLHAAQMNGHLYRSHAACLDIFRASPMRCQVIPRERARCTHLRNSLSAWATTVRNEGMSSIIWSSDRSRQVSPSSATARVLDSKTAAESMQSEQIVTPGPATRPISSETCLRQKEHSLRSVGLLIKRADRCNQTGAESESFRKAMPQKLYESY